MRGAAGGPYEGVAHIYVQGLSKKLT